ncbi:MAG: PLP-dependent transferase, partial [Oscillospiraceae bacterium]|nr:PLP-dependent transferase [Oscillospiraceae bacterium]
AAHAHSVPLIVDNTFATPVLCRPMEWGADIVIHSTSKYMDGHAVQVGGVIVDSGKFDWTSGKFSCMTEPDESYHGIVYTKQYAFAPYIVKARMQLMRDFGCYPAANSSFLLNLGLETLPVRMRQYCKNAMAVAEFIQSSDKVQSVTYPSLRGNKYKALADKYLPEGASGVISISIKGGRDNAVKFMDSLKLASNEVHVADIRTCVLHPASATHRQLTDEQLAAAGIDGGLIRLSVGLENVEDIIADVKQALDSI